MENAIKTQRAIIYFIATEKVKSSNIVRRLVSVFGAKALMKYAVYDWISQISNGTASLEDGKRGGRSTCTITDSVVTIVEESDDHYRRISVREVAGTHGISLGSAHQILYNCLGLSECNALSVPFALGDNQ